MKLLVGGLHNRKEVLPPAKEIEQCGRIKIVHNEHCVDNVSSTILNRTNRTSLSVSKKMER